MNVLEKRKHVQNHYRINGLLPMSLVATVFFCISSHAIDLISVLTALVLV